MRLEYVETFVVAVVSTLEQVLQAGFGRGAVTLVAGPGSREGITVVIPLGGEAAGNISLHMSGDTATKLFNHAAGQTHETLPPLGLDYLKELGNLIAGAAASALNDQGYEVTVAPPLAENAAQRAGQPEMEACRIPIFSEFGGLTVNITLATG